MTIHLPGLLQTYFSGGNVYDYARPKRSIDPELSIFWTAEMVRLCGWLSCTLP